MQNLLGENMHTTRLLGLTLLTSLGLPSGGNLSSAPAASPSAPPSPPNPPLPPGFICDNDQKFDSLECQDVYQLNAWGQDCKDCGPRGPKQFFDLTQVPSILTVEKLPHSEFVFHNINGTHFVPAETSNSTLSTHNEEIIVQLKPGQAIKINASDFSIFVFESLHTDGMYMGNFFSEIYESNSRTFNFISDSSETNLVSATFSLTTSAPTSNVIFSQLPNFNGLNFDVYIGITDSGIAYLHIQNEAQTLGFRLNYPPSIYLYQRDCADTECNLDLEYGKSPVNDSTIGLYQEYGAPENSVNTPIQPPKPSSPSPPGICKDIGPYGNDNVCDDGGPGSDFSDHEYGHDCFDCGPRSIKSPSPPVSPPAPLTPTTSPSAPPQEMNYTWHLIIAIELGSWILAASMMVLTDKENRQATASRINSLEVTPAHVTLPATSTHPAAVSSPGDIELTLTSPGEVDNEGGQRASTEPLEHSV